MSYIVFARKYRPQTFDDVVGQSHITNTLKNAITQSRVAHAYLFAGPRGVGKTTTARIFAKALNCENGPAANPCNKCSACTEITQASSLDIMEIDGASSRGIEEIRSLRENVKFAPSAGRFKIYIIDEIHMLTSEAFNALLKTLEEPPPHIKFIFATTSPYKVPLTILSRCQRFDFRRISTKDISDNLKMIAKDEGIKVDGESLGLIARYADGSMRDAQVILDQISSSGDGRISVDDVTSVLGVVDDDILFGLSAAIKDRDPGKALDIVDRMMNEGKDALQVVLGLVEHFRNISVAKISRRADKLIDSGEDKIERYRAEAGKFSIEEMLYVIYMLSNTIDFMKRSNLARIPLEASLIKLTTLQAVMPLSEIASKIEALQANNAQAARVTPQARHVQAKASDVKDTAPSSEKAPAAAAPKTPPAPSLDMEEISGYWVKVINYVRPKKISVASYMQEGSPVGIESNVLTIGFPRECQFHKDVLESVDNKKFIEEAILAVTGISLLVSFTMMEPGNSGPERAASEGMAGSDEMSRGEETGADESDPIVKAALNMFSGKVAGNGKDKRR